MTPSVSTTARGSACRHHGSCTKTHITLRSKQLGRIITGLCCPDSYITDLAHLDNIVIAVKGVCRGHGQRNARGAIGVFFHGDNRLNRSMALITAFTSQRADLCAALRALKLAKRIRKKNGKCRNPAGLYRKLRREVVKTNSMYLVDAVVEHIDRWKDNGYVNAKGEEVVNEDLFRQLDDAIEDLERMRVVVQLYHVPKDENEQATHLANDALD